MLILEYCFLKSYLLSLADPFIHESVNLWCSLFNQLSTVCIAGEAAFMRHIKVDIVTLTFFD